MKLVIRIANPTQGGKQYTSPKRASHFLRRGEAVLTDVGELFFYQAAAVLEKRERERVDAEIIRWRSGIIFWNGSGKNPKAMHRPGEARS